MMCVVVGARRDERLAYEALERYGLADPAHRELARQEVMVFTPDNENALRGMTLETDDVFFLEGWERAVRANDRFGFLMTLQMAGVDLDECGRLAF